MTPDSFSDGGRYLDAEAAVAHAVRLVEEGADLLDIGAESTRPGAEPLMRQKNFVVRFLLWPLWQEPSRFRFPSIPRKPLLHRRPSTRGQSS